MLILNRKSLFFVMKHLPGDSFPLYLCYIGLVYLYRTMQVNFLSKLVALRPGKAVEEMIKNVMQGKDEGADHSSNDEGNTTNGRISGRIKGRVSYLSVNT